MVGILSDFKAIGKRFVNKRFRGSEVQGFRVLGSEVQCSARPPAKKTAGQIERKKLMNIEHRTLNVEHRIMYSVYLKKD
ncbi:hypothetical protein N9893_03065 [bacterium]|nr:hypothetical protein [bacterium]